MDQNIDQLEMLVDRWIKRLDDPQSPRCREQTKDWLFGAAHVLHAVGRHDLFDKIMALVGLKAF